MLRFSQVLTIVCTAGIAYSQSTSAHALTEVYHNDDFQITGVSVSKTGRVFVNFPRWSDKYLNAVMEVTSGGAKPFPDENWNRWDQKPASAPMHFVCVQSVVVDDTDALWVVDAAAPLLASVVPGGPKLVKVDLKTNQVARVISFGADVVKPGSYLNDIRIDTRRNTAYLTDSGVGGIVVVDLVSGKAHRSLDGDPSVLVEQGTSIVINGKPVIGPTGKPPMFNSDGIALSPDGQYLYYQALTGATLYRVKTDALRGSGAAKPEKVARTFPLDGMWMDAHGRLYLSNLNQNAVSRLSTDGKIETVVTDVRLQWPDTFSEGPDGSIYITASHIHESPTYNKGKSVRTQPYAVFRFRP